MKKIMILVLSIITVTGLGSCEQVGNTLYLLNHLNTMDSMGTYVIEIESNKQVDAVDEIDSRFVYVDNNNNTFLVSDFERDNFEVQSGDFIFEVYLKEVYGYIFTSIWTKYQINSDFEDIKYIEKDIFHLFNEATYTNVDDIYIYETTTTLQSLEGKVFNIFDIDFDDEDMDTEFPITAEYSSLENRFLSFTFDLSPILTNIDTDLEGESDWFITLAFSHLNQEFEIDIEEQAQDDYVDGFDHNSMIDIAHRYSYEMIKGSIDYSVDRDLIQIEFEQNGIYQIRTTRLENIETLYITILDEDKDFVRTFEIDSCDTLTNYWPYEKGIYYLIVSGDIDMNEATNYSFLFLSN